MKSILSGLVALIVCAAGLAPVHAADEDYPSKPIRLVVPFAPGGSTDILVRPLAERMSKLLSVPVLVDNRGGAGGNLGADMVAKAAPDGYTLMVTTSGVLTANKALYDKLPYDPAADFAPITIIASLPNVLVVAPASPFRTVADVLKEAKDKPGTLSFASGGVGTSNHLAGELLKSVGGVNMTHVPFRGGGPAVLSVVAGQVPMIFATLPSAIAQIQGGRLRALAVTSPKRAPSLPNVPTLAEAGVKDAEVSIWIGALAPKGTPARIVEKLNAAISQALDTPEVQEKLRVEGYEKVANTPAQMAQVVRTETTMWTRVIKEAGIKAE